MSGQGLNRAQFPGPGKQIKTDGGNGISMRKRLDDLRAAVESGRKIESLLDLIEELNEIFRQLYNLRMKG